MRKLLLILFGGWTKKKPEFDHEFLLLTATKIKRTGRWDYTLWLIEKVDGPDGWYYGLCTQEGEEWGDRDDLAADLYKKIPCLHE